MSMRTLFMVLAALTVTGCGGSPAAPGAAGTATIVVIGNKGVAKTHLVSDQKKVAALEEFFPNYRKRPTHPVSVGWAAGYFVYFDFPQGESVKLVVSPTTMQQVSWTMGQGDFPVKGDFAKFLSELDE